VGAALTTRHEGIVVVRLRWREDTGASSVEYGMIVFAIAATLVTIVVSLGIAVNNSYEQSCQTIDSKIGSGNCP
jgi:Flp pilus assembly pilin Flp